MSSKKINLSIIWLSCVFLLLTLSSVFSNDFVIAQDSDDDISSDDASDYSINLKVQWYQTYGSILHQSGITFIKTSDGGYMITGYRRSETSHTDVQLLKIDESGNFQWEREYGTVNSLEQVYDIVQTQDGGYAFTGSNESDIMLGKTDSNGILEWSKIYQVPAGSNLESKILSTNDHGYELLSKYGSSMSYPPEGKSWGSMILKTDQDGIPQWNYTVPWLSGNGGDCQYNSFVQSQDKGFVLSGDYNGGNENRICLLKTNNIGIEQWNQTYVNLNGSIDASALIQTIDGGFAIGGTIEFRLIDRNYYSMLLLKTNHDGVFQWNQSFGGSLQQSAFGSDLAQNEEGEIFLVGTTNVGYIGSGGQTAFLIIKSDSLGIKQWEYTFGGENRAHPRIMTTLDGFVIIGNNNLEGPRYDIFMVLFSENDIEINQNLVGENVIFAFIVLFTLTATGMYIQKNQLFQRRFRSSVNNIVKETVSKIFNGNSKNFLLLAAGFEKTVDTWKLESRIPENLIKNKFLMHPVRLSIMKILSEYNSIPSSDLKTKLGLSWSEFSHHLPILKKYNLILTEDHFFEGNVKQIIIITEVGVSQYAELVKTLIEYLSSSDFEKLYFDLH